MNAFWNNVVTRAAMSFGNGVGDDEGYERVFQLYWSPSVNQRSFLWRNCAVFRGLWFECGLRGVKTWCLEDCPYEKNEAWSLVPGWGGGKGIS